MSLFTLWLVFVLPEFFTGLGVMCGIAAVVVGFLGGIGILTYADFNDKDGEWVLGNLKPLKKWVIGLVAVCILTGLVPSTQTMRWMVGGYFVTNIETIDQLPPNIVKAANKFLEEYTDTE